MKRFYHNMSNEIKTYRTWMLTVESMDQSDFKWLHAFDIPVRIEKPEHTFDTASGRQHTVYGKPTYTIDTVNDKQRDMVILKYGNDAILIQEEHVLPGTISTCTLSTLTW